jgi:hypothetical protein
MSSTVKVITTVGKPNSQEACQMTGMS